MSKRYRIGLLTRLALFASLLAVPVFAKLNAAGLAASVSTNAGVSLGVSSTNSESITPQGPLPDDALAARYTPTSAAQLRQRWLLLGLMVVLLGTGAVYRNRKKRGSRG